MLGKFCRRLLSTASTTSSSVLQSSVVPYVGHRGIRVDVLSLLKDLQALYPQHARTLTEYISIRTEQYLKTVPSYQIYKDLPRITNSTIQQQNQIALPLCEEDINFDGKYWKVAEEWRGQPGMLRNDLLLVLASQRESGRDVAARLERELAQVDAQQAVRWSEWRSRLEDVKLKAKYIYSIMLICIYFTIFGELFIWRKR